jgi:hypothetical protein
MASKRHRAANEKIDILGGFMGGRYQAAYDERPGPGTTLIPRLEAYDYMAGKRQDYGKARDAENQN